MRDRETKRERPRHRQREKQDPCKEPNVGLDPRSPGSRPVPKAGTKPLRHPGIPVIPFFKKDFIYLFMTDIREREREAETQAEGEAGSMQGAQCGTRSQDSRIMPVSYTHLTLPTNTLGCRSRWSPYH